MVPKSCIEIVEPAPVLNTPEFHRAFGGECGAEIPRNSLGHPKHFEFIALPGQLFTIEKIHARHHHSIYQVSSPHYTSCELYVDSRFTKPSSKNSSDPPAALRRDELAYKMRQLLGTSYVWGGNWSAGISRMLQLYPPQKALDEKTRALWTLKGVDCSGLLYETSGGITPRNTSGLIHFGKALPIQGQTALEIASQLWPMDMVIWPGHVWFVLDARHSIESKSPFGVIQRALLERLEETCHEHTAVNAWPEEKDLARYFTIRRFCVD